MADEYKFRYLVDTPIFSLFAEPGRNYKMVAAFPSLIGEWDDGDDASDYDTDASLDAVEHVERNALYANALLTGEFIFKVARQTGEPVLVSSEHVSEIYHYIATLEQRSGALYRQSVDALREVYATLQRRLVLEAQAVEPGGQWLPRIRQSLVALLADASDSPLLAPYRLWTLFSEGAIANAAVALDFPQSVISPPYDALSKWRTRIQVAKRFNRVLPNSLALDADAVTLAQLEYANKDWDTTGEVCVLITSDRGLHRAYSDYVTEARLSGIKPPPFYALRDPRQYTPILNVSDMEGQYSDPSIFSKVEGSIREFVSSFSSTDLAPFRHYEADPSALPDSALIRRAIRNRMSAHAERIAPFADQISEEISHIAATWLDAVEYSVAAKTDVISELAHREMQLWRRATSRTLLTNSFAEQIDDVRLSFEKLATSSTLLRQEIWALEHGPEELAEEPGHNRRAIASNFQDYKTPDFMGKTLDAILQDLRRNRAGAIPMLRRADRAERLFITGCLSLQIGAWAGARSLLERADAMKHRAEFAQEVTFFRCMAQRLAASLEDYPDDYKAVRRNLKQLREASANSRRSEDPRFRNEQLALELCELAYVAYQNKNVTATLRNATSIWQRMKEKFRGRLTEPAIDPYWRAISRQFILNSCNLLFWTTVTNSEAATDLHDCVEELVRNKANREFEYVLGGVHGTLYPLLAEYALSSSDAASLLVARRIGDAIDEALSLDQSRGFAFDLPFVDKAEFIAIMARIDPARIPAGVQLM